MINRHQPHVLVLPEDDANRQIANGFVNSVLKSARVQILAEAGGWTAVRDSFARQHNAAMEKYAHQYMVLLVDFDEKEERRRQVLSEVKQGLQERVFVVGAWDEPEKLKKELGLKYEKIGEALAKDCAEQTSVTWGHPSLSHN